MNLPDFLKATELIALRQRMGAAELGDITLVADTNRLTELELERLVSGGLDVSSIDEVRVLPDGTLAYKDSRVLVYIRDVTTYAVRSWDRRSKLPRFHLANCETLQQMRREKRYERYVVAARQDGRFEVNFIETDRSVRSSTERLHVCQNCLTFLAFDGFQMTMQRTVREARVASFKLEQFFQSYPRALHIELPPGRSDSAPLNTYPEDFDSLAKKTKEDRGWRCEGEGCGVILDEPGLRKYLHVHHINGQKHDSRPENLKTLCSVCHAEEPRHGHMRDLPDVEVFRPIRARLLNNMTGVKQAAEMSQQNASSLDAETKFSDNALRALLRVHNVKYEDNRLRNGAIWVRVGRSPRDLASRLQEWGFRYKEGRGWWRT
jgi:hypothetical protein